MVYIVFKAKAKHYIKSYMNLFLKQKNIVVRRYFLFYFSHLNSTASSVTNTLENTTDETVQ